jgi:hypothetical protein
MDATGKPLRVGADFIEVKEISKVNIAIPTVVCHVGFDGGERFFVFIGHLHVGQHNPAGDPTLGAQDSSPHVGGTGLTLWRAV